VISELNMIEDDLTGAEICDLLRLHLSEMHTWSPPESCHVMPVERLRQADVTFWSAWHGDNLAGCGALKEIDSQHGEIKSMRAHPDYRGKGIGKAILLHLLGEAKQRGYARISRETGRPQPFIPAQRLYEGHGFAECPPFGDYVSDDFSMCMTKEL
jgi:putative acetyltransferase